jgi:hypothetical protein
VPSYVITAPDGRKFRVTGPGSQQEALAQVQSQYAGPTTAPAGKSAIATPDPAIAEPEKSSALQNYLGYSSEPILNVGTSMIAGPVAGLAGIAGSVLPGEPGQGARWTENVQDALVYQPRTDAGKATTSAITYPFRKLAEGADFVGGKAAQLTGSPAVGAAVNTTLQSAPAVLLRAKPSGTRPPAVRRPVDAGEGTPAPSPAAAKRAPGLETVREAAPSLEELSRAAEAAYKRADDAGITVSAQSLTGLRVGIKKMLQQEGVDPTLHPSTTAALKRVNEARGELKLSQLETLRRIANDARKSNAPADARLAGKIVDEIDDYIGRLSEKDVTSGKVQDDDYIGRLSEKDVTSGKVQDAAALKDARDLYSRKMKAQEISRLMERAEISAQQFSGSGLENAIRTEFRSLAKDQKRMRRFTPEERAAIVKVAKGGALENTLRMLGKFAPTGNVSTALSGMTGFLAGGPAGAVGLPAAGFASRYMATRMTKKNASAAEELMRRGPQRQNVLAEKKRNALADQ